MASENRKKSISRIIAFLWIIILIISSGFYLQSCKKNDSVRIGVIISLSGPGAHMAEVLEGLQLASEEINKYGGISSKKIEFIVQNNESDPDKAVKLFDEIEDKYKPDLYITALSSISEVLAPKAKAAGVPILCLVTTDIEIGRGNDWFFRFYSTPVKEITPIIYFIKKLHIKNLGVAYIDDAYGKAVLAELEKKNEDIKINITAKPFDRKNTKVSDTSLKILENDAVYIIGFSGDCKNAFSSLKAAGYKGYILAPASAAQNDVRSFPASDGVYTAAPAIYNAEYPFAENLKLKMEEKYKHPLNHYGANGYEGIKMLEGLLSGKEITRESIQAALSSGFVYTGSLGKISVKKGDHNFDFDLLPAVNTGGVLEYE